MDWKVKIEEQIRVASKGRFINKTLKKLAKVCLDGDTEFYLVFSKSREQYVYLKFKSQMTKTTARLLLTNGFKNFYLNNKNK